MGPLTTPTPIDSGHAQPTPEAFCPLLKCSAESIFIACNVSDAIASRTNCFLLRYIVEAEGPRALWRGLGPNLVGVAPSRAIYFCSYSQMKKFLNGHLHNSKDGPIVHILSASWAGLWLSPVYVCGSVSFFCDSLLGMSVALS